ncbi:hypothetical protein ACJJTC_009024, partial [Scirpophaga incertulas]
MDNLNNDMVDEIVKTCLHLYQKLPKSGKPVDDEWTVCCCIVQFDKDTSCFEVVSLGTGSKCIGATKMSPTGDLLNDSHAEIIARRGFLVYLYDNMEKAVNEEPSIFRFSNNKFRLKSNIEFIFYSSQLPCGDAAIMPKNCNMDHIGEIIIAAKRKADDEISEIFTKKPRVETVDIYRTGAKCLPNSEQDLKCPGAGYHLLGQVRTKPGRGDRTLSVSCSDKIARWIHLGIHGALLDILIDQPIYMKLFIFGSDIACSEGSLKRAFFERNHNTIYKMDYVPKLCRSSVKFLHLKNDSKPHPAPGSIIWIKLKGESIHEVAVHGRKLGLTKKKAISPSNSLCITKYNLYKRFQHLILQKDLQNIFNLQSIENITYNEMKRKSHRYIEKWTIVKKNFFKTWTCKPDIWGFCLRRRSLPNQTIYRGIQFNG